MEYERKIIQNNILFNDLHEIAKEIREHISETSKKLCDDSRHVSKNSVKNQLLNFSTTTSRCFKPVREENE